jgi:hypothetical protein
MQRFIRLTEMINTEPKSIILNTFDIVEVYEADDDEDDISSHIMLRTESSDLDIVESVDTIYDLIHGKEPSKENLKFPEQVEAQFTSELYGSFGDGDAFKL